MHGRLPNNTDYMSDDEFSALNKKKKMALKLLESWNITVHVFQDITLYIFMYNYGVNNCTDIVDSNQTIPVSNMTVSSKGLVRLID